MHRFYISPEQIRDKQAFVIGDELKHLARVLRLKPGDQVVLFDGNGWEYEGVIRELTPDAAEVELTESAYLPRESLVKVQLMQGLPKGDKMEWIIQKNTELGVHTFLPWEAARSVVRLEGRKKDERVGRWRKVALEAAKQCRRAHVPTVSDIRNLKEVLTSLPPQRLLLAPWEEGGRPLKKVLRDFLQDNRNESIMSDVYIVIGPEGGLEEGEIDQIREVGGLPVTLGPRILRTETAGLIAAAAVLYELGDLGG